jgi:aminoglycoside 6'-N-acetyltransferase
VPRAGKERRIRMVVLRGKRVLLRPGRSEDAERLVQIRNEPEVALRWGNVDIEEEVVEGFIGREEGFVVEVDGEVVGAIQYGEEDDPMYRHANMDIFLATSCHGQGIGTEAIRLLARHLFEGRGHHRLTIDPAADNAAAIRAYEKAGFRRVGIMRNYERGTAGVWHDGLLMDLLEGELRS